MLDELEIQDVHIGLKLISAVGTPGQVVQVILESDNRTKSAFDRVRYDTINIKWDNGKTSTIFHPMESIHIKIGVK